MPADVCPHSSKQVANCWCDAKMCLVKQKKNQQLLFRSAHWQRLHVFPDTVIRNFKLIWILTAWKCVSETSPAESPKKKKNLNVYSRISVKSDRQKTLNPEEGTTNALSTIYQMLHVFFPLNYNLKKKTKKQTHWNDKCVSAKFFFLFLTSSDESSRPHQQQQRLWAHFKNDHKL